MACVPVRLLVLSVAVASLWSCSQGPTPDDVISDKSNDADAVAFLKKSMDVYAKMPAFSATCTVRKTAQSATANLLSRKIQFAAPNLYKIVTTDSLNYDQSATSDGQQELDAASSTRQAPLKYPAPASIQEADSMFMKDPTFCGSLLYQFFGGSANFKNIVDIDSSGAVTFEGYKETGAAELARVVNFNGPKKYGRIRMLIGKDSGLVYGIQYGALAGKLAPTGRELLRHQHALDDFSSPNSALDRREQFGGGNRRRRKNRRIDQAARPLRQAWARFQRYRDGRQSHEPLLTSWAAHSVAVLGYMV